MHHSLVVLNVCQDVYIGLFAPTLKERVDFLSNSKTFCLRELKVKLKVTVFTTSHFQYYF